MNNWNGIPQPLRSAIIVFPVLVLSLLAGCKSSPKQLEISVEDVWSRPAPSGSNGVVYLVILNKGGAPDRLLSVRTDLARTAEIHETRMQDDVMRMQPVEGALEVPPDSQVEFKPGATHIMLIGLKRALQAGETLQLILKFEKSGERVIESEIRG
ncbi:MAG: copper chaperone PCu(A)C [bacterium]